MKELIYPHELHIGDYIQIVSGLGTQNMVFKVIEVDGNVKVKSMVNSRWKPFYLYLSVGVVRLNEDEAIFKILQGNS